MDFSRQYLYTTKPHGENSGLLAEVLWKEILETIHIYGEVTYDLIDTSS